MLYVSSVAADPIHLSLRERSSSEALAEEDGEGGRVRGSSHARRTALGAPHPNPLPKGEGGWPSFAKHVLNAALEEGPAADPRAPRGRGALFLSSRIISD